MLADLLDTHLADRCNFRPSDEELWDLWVCAVGEGRDDSALFILGSILSSYAHASISGPGYLQDHCAIWWRAWLLQARSTCGSGSLNERGVVIAGTRRLRARWSLEASDDLRSFHSMDLVQELERKIVKEIQEDIDRQILVDLTVDPKIR